MNNDLISRSALLKEAEDNVTGFIDVKQIEAAPAVDAEMVVRAEWIWKPEEQPQLGENPTLLDRMKDFFENCYAPNEMWHCSHCGKPAIEQLTKYLTYSSLPRNLFKNYVPNRCPNCDALMNKITE